MFGCMVGTAMISLVSSREYLKGVGHVIGEHEMTKNASLVIFSVFGLPLSVSIHVHLQFHYILGVEKD